jgi:hypothetical protein
MRVLILVQNLPVPFDRRVWQEAIALTEAGYEHRNIHSVVSCLMVSTFIATRPARRLVAPRHIFWNIR